ncbi:hypothetical protein H6G26_34235 [Nostoc sp. FACHB-888]|nr:hypothetical protein [Nostoc sp. FACHB-888]
MTGNIGDVYLPCHDPDHGKTISIKFYPPKLFKQPLSPAYLEREKYLHVPDDLRVHKCLLFTLPNFRSRWLFRDSNGTVSEVPIEGDIVISNALGLRDCALAGMGPALLANWLIDEDIAQGKLIDLFANYHVTATDFETAAWLLYPSKTYLPNKVRVMINFLKRKCSDCK